MPSSGMILENVTAAANQWQAVAIAWHVLLGVFMVALVSGWRPQKDLAGITLVVPLGGSIALAAVATRIPRSERGALHNIHASETQRFS